MENIIIENKGDDTLHNFLKEFIDKDTELKLTIGEFSIYAFYDLLKEIKRLKSFEVILTEEQFHIEEASFSKRFEIAQQQQNICGNNYELTLKNNMNSTYIARVINTLIQSKVNFKLLKPDKYLTNQMILKNKLTQDKNVFLPSIYNFSSDGIGTQPSNSLTPITAITGDENIVRTFSNTFDNNWKDTDSVRDHTDKIIERLTNISSENTPEWLYYVSLYHIFHNQLDELDEKSTIKEGTGFKETTVWNTLYDFQKDGVVGLISKLEKYNGAILADSVGLGKTFSALAVIKYYELRNDKVLVLSPKRLRENWTIYTQNDVRNVLADDRFNYDVLNHTDLSRYHGFSGDIDLKTINWGNYDLVVIDESHNFRNNNPTKNDRPTRYERLMDEIIKQGVNTKVLMLSATPVNNRMNDLKNQIAFIINDNPQALEVYGIDDVDNELRVAQTRYNEWAKLEENKRTTSRFLEMLNSGYFKILDLLTIARSRKHIVKYYDTKEIGDFPKRLKPISIKSDIDTQDNVSSIKDVNDEIKSLNLSLYQQMAYVLPNRKARYEELYDTQTARGIFRQEDRETSLTGLIRVNLLKRLESSIHSFTLTVSRMVKQIEDILKVISRSQNNDIILPSLIDYDDEELETAFEDYAVGKKNKILLGDMDLHRWKLDLQEDLEKLKQIQNGASSVTPIRDEKLNDLLRLIDNKIKNPINKGNRKILIFTAFADTANYLHDHVSEYVKKKHGLNSALITGGGTNKSNMSGIKVTNMEDILVNFSPISKHRNKIDEAATEEIDILIATDTISEGQNLQDADYLVNYDIHWNPVRVVQRFGRIDRIGSRNTKIQLVNFWPNMELDEYINLENRVRGRMVLSNVSSTGEDDVINEDADKRDMNDMNYRRKQMKQLQEQVVDLEDIDGAISVTDLTYNEFKSDLSEALKVNENELVTAPTGMYAITDADLLDEAEPGIILTLKQLSNEDKEQSGLYPYLVIYMRQDGTVKLNHLHTNQILSIYKKLAKGKNIAFQSLVDQFNNETQEGKNMEEYSCLLTQAIEEIKGKTEEVGIQSLFTPGGTHFESADNLQIDDFELISFLMIRE
nr:helicase-related protein [Enterococcus hirae]